MVGLMFCETLPAAVYFFCTSDSKMSISSTNQYPLKLHVYINYNVVYTLCIYLYGNLLFNDVMF